MFVGASGTGSENPRVVYEFEVQSILETFDFHANKAGYGPKSCVLHKLLKRRKPCPQDPKIWDVSMNFTIWQRGGHKNRWKIQHIGVPGLAEEGGEGNGLDQSFQRVPEGHQWTVTVAAQIKLVRYPRI